MDRRDFLKTSSAAALTASLVAAAVEAQAADDTSRLAAPQLGARRREVRLVTRFADGVTGAGDLVRRLAARISAATDGHWRIDVADADGRCLEAVMAGGGDLYVATENDHLDLHPAFAFFAGLPCGAGLDAARFEAWISAGGGQELWDELASAFNIKSLVVGHSGPSSGIFSNRPVRACADFRGFRLAIDGLAREVVKACDGEPVAFSGTDAAGAIAAGEIDGVELIGATLDMTQAPLRRFGALAPYRLLPGLNSEGSAITLGMRASFWDGLSNSERIVLQAIAGEAAAASRADAVALTVARRSFDPTGEHWPDEQSGSELQAALARIGDAIVADSSGYDRLSRRINASYMAFRDDPGMPGTV